MYKKFSIFSLLTCLVFCSGFLFSSDNTNTKEIDFFCNLEKNSDPTLFTKKDSTRSSDSDTEKVFGQPFFFIDPLIWSDNSQVR